MAGTVLVAEDDVELLDAIGDSLVQHGRTVRKAHNGDELISAMADGSYDLVITDVAMPWMTGLQASHAARYAGLATPILVITALEDPKLADHVAALGSRARLLRKPFELAALEREVDQLLADAPASGR